MKGDKSERQAALQSIISGKTVSSQEELLVYLSSEGWEVTQATLSRDLKEMKVVKMHSPSGGYYYSLPPKNPATAVAMNAGPAACITSVRFSGQICVIKTLPGYASMVASILDASPVDDVMGSIAGDDTLLILLTVGTDLHKLASNINNYIPGILSKVK